MSDYVEKVKQRILSGDLSKPEELYPLLVKELGEKKEAVANFINSLLAMKELGDEPYVVIDIGGASGGLVSQLNVPVKYVVDKREFDRIEGVRYLNGEYRHDQTAGTDIAIYSEFLHLFKDEDIAEIITECKSKYVVVIENVPDDFLDLRLRLWSEGRVLNPEFMNKLMGISPSIVNNYFIWVKKNDL